jgi:hypothetical protein
VVENQVYEHRDPAPVPLGHDRTKIS